MSKLTSKNATLNLVIGKGRFKFEFEIPLTWAVVAIVAILVFFAPNAWKAVEFAISLIQP